MVISVAYLRPIFPQGVLSRENGPTVRTLQRLIDRSPIPAGTIPVGIGLAVTGIASYAFLVISARALGPDAYSGLAVLWAAVFLVGPGFFIPFEQEVARLLTHRRVHETGTGPVMRKATALGSAFTALILLGAIALIDPISTRVFEGDRFLFVALLVGIVGSFTANFSEGILAGHARFARYGAYLGSEALIRLAFCLVCVAIGVTTPGPFGMALGIAPLLAVIPSFAGAKGIATPGVGMRWRELTVSLGVLTAGSLFSQVLVNAPPVLAQVFDKGDDSGGTTVGAFTAALVLARVPFFLFQAVQAALLPTLAAMVARREFRQFWKNLIGLIALVGGLAGVATVIAFVAGSDLVGLFFGSDFVVTNRTVGMLALGSTCYLIAMALAHAVIALAAPRFVAIGWGAGALMLVLVSGMGPSGLFAIELGYVAGSVTSVIAMSIGLVMLRGTVAPIANK